MKYLLALPSPPSWALSAHCHGSAVLTGESKHSVLKLKPKKNCYSISDNSQEVLWDKGQENVTLSWRTPGKCCSGTLGAGSMACYSHFSHLQGNTCPVPEIILCSESPTIQLWVANSNLSCFFWTLYVTLSSFVLWRGLTFCFLFTSSAWPVILDFCHTTQQRHR